MGMWKEFKEFAVKGNVMDMAVGIIIGGAFGKIANSLVADVVMPPIGVLLGKVNFADLKYVIQPGVDAVVDEAGTELVAAVPEVAINYGAFLQTAIDFFVIAFCVFLVVKGMNAMRRKNEAEAEAAK
ncbi:MAG: large-conductance mechanosensitive channel protein MscL [Kiritimatiellae bacterium]|nr:large-conductance mechanosensitive channel protein MscL [Kiritimatiellia bacterium]MBQ9345287.1 large-conductance mechanosensitive channel protein MscL [Kiritimatiellia bacterium]